MKILFTKSSAPLSVIIRKVTKEPVSHCAIVLNGMVIQSNLKGLIIVDEIYFRKQCTVVYEIEIPSTEFDENSLHVLTAQYEGSFYDFGALLFSGFSLAARAYLHVPLPKSNLWQMTGMFLCTEWVSRVIDGKEDSMITPYGLYLKLLDSPKS